MYRAFILILVAFGALGIFYSITTPLFETPDEREHFAVIQHIATGRGLPVQAEPPDHFARQEGSQPPLYYLLGAALTFWIDTSDFPGIVWENPHYGYTVPGIVNDNKNLFIHTALESFPYRGAVLAIRIARWLAVLIGALAVLFTFLFAREILRDPFLAVLASAVVAFVPQFIFISGAVSNDSTIAATSAFALWLIARMMRAQPTTRNVLALGIACGLAAISKVSGAGLFALALVALGWQMWHTRQQPNFFRNIILNFSLFTFTFSLVAGWWYARNLVLYGELTGTELMTRIFFARETPLTFDQLIAQLAEVWETFWVGFGWGNVRAQPAIYSIIAVAVLASLIGLIKFMIYDLGFRSFVASRVRSKQKSEIINHKSQILIPALWFIIVLAALVRWMMVTQAPHGRLLFPALPAIAVLVVFGLAQIGNWKLEVGSWKIAARILSFAHLSFVIFLFAISASAPFTLIRPAYAYPQTLHESDLAQIPNRVDIEYEGKIKLLGYTISARAIYPGDARELTLYWQALAAMDEDYTIAIRVLDAHQRVIGTRDSYPGHGMLPTRVMRAGQIIRDVYWLPIAPENSTAQILVSLYNRRDKRDLIARDPRGEIITPFIGQIRIAPE
ncbi:MAG: phospholipid carrier-dependent glycosyltransferase [Chloroflexi bacterium]|nr:phospholipid carrier-dependent glycosyltransferase [Chloroflexota bacterium]